MFSFLFRLILIAAIGYGGYRVYNLQRLAKTCEVEVRNLEASVNNLLYPNPDSVTIRQLSYDQLYSLWLYNAPPGKAIEVQLQYNSADQLQTETLLRIPSRATAHHGTIELQFDVDTRPPMTRVKQLNVFGPDFRKAEVRTSEPQRFDAIRFVNQLLTRDVSYLSPASANNPGSNNLSGLFLSSRLSPGVVFMKGSIEVSHTPSQTIGQDQFVLCAFDEVEDTGAKMVHMMKLIRVVASDD